MYFRHFLVLVTITATLLYNVLQTPLAQAQGLPILPDSIRPERLLSPQQQLSLPLAKPSPQTPRAITTTTTENDVLLPQLQSVKIYGAKALSLKELSLAWQPYLNKPLGTKGIENILRHIARIYRDAGILLGQAEVVELNADKGILLLKTTEPSLRDVIYAESDGTKAKLSENPLLQRVRKKLLDATPLRTKDLEQAILGISALPGINATATLKPYMIQEGSPPAIALVITLKRDRKEGFIALDNRASRFTGPWQLSVNGTQNGVFGAFDALSTRLLTGFDNQELRGGEMRYRVPFDTATSLTFSALKSWSEPGFTLKDFQIENQSEQLSVSLQHHITQTRNRNFSLSGVFSARNSSGKTFGQLYSEERIRSVSVGASLDVADRWGGSTLVSTELEQGVPIFDSSTNDDPLLSRQNGRVDYTKITLNANHIHPLTTKISVLTGVTGQWAGTQLLAGEEFGYGGNTFGRGYNPSEITGDHGVAGLLELRYDQPLQTHRIKSLQFYGSHDYGAVWRIDSTNRTARLTGSSAALGFRLNLPTHWAVDMQVSKPLTRPTTAFAEDDNKDPRAFLSFLYNF
jgi:hemolysin activation/secretion protein